MSQIDEIREQMRWMDPPKVSLKAAYIENFKNIKQTAIHFKPITLLFGRNSAGKSTIIDAITLFADVLNARKVSFDSISKGALFSDMG